MSMIAADLQDRVVLQSLLKTAVEFRVTFQSVL